jgi:hypothetical protein
MIKWLEENEAEIGEVAKLGRNSIHIAAQKGHLEVVK